MKNLKLTALLLLASIVANANPNAVINLDAHYDAQNQLMTPDNVLLVKAIKAYQQGYNQSALSKFQQAAAFGNSHAQMYIGMMYLKSIGVEQDWAKGYAWIKLAALDGTKKNMELMRSVYSQLKPDEIKQAYVEYEKISEDYDISATLKRRDRWVRKQKLKSTGSRTGSQTTNVHSKALNGSVQNGDMSSNFEVMENFINNYQFGVVSQGEIKPKAD